MTEDRLSCTSAEAEQVDGSKRRQYTPGPWRLFLTTDGRKMIGIGEVDGDGITDCGFGTWRSGEEQLANARLITAAPDLLEALKEAEQNLVGAYGEPDPNGPRSLESLSGRQAILTVRAAIAKATGR